MRKNDKNIEQQFDDMCSMFAFANILDEFFEPRPNQRRIDKLMVQAKPYTDQLTREAGLTKSGKRVRIAKSVLQKDEHKWLGQMGVTW
jgi:hypothetical protein